MHTREEPISVGGGLSPLKGNDKTGNRGLDPTYFYAKISVLQMDVVVEKLEFALILIRIH
ncbi:MAG: hypothetical protein R2766_11545 [Saprospiraceae bacterium]